MVSLKVTLKETSVIRCSPPAVLASDDKTNPRVARGSANHSPYCSPTYGHRCQGGYL